MDVRDYPNIPLTHKWTPENFQALLAHLREIDLWGSTNMYGPVANTPRKYTRHSRGTVLFEKVFYGKCLDLPLLIQLTRHSIEYPLSAAILKWRLEHGI